jgi:arylsulfatase A-like enzyme
MKPLFLLSLALLGSLVLGCQNIQSTKPNVIIILTDDQGYGDFSCHGNPILETPALDKLYNESITFSNFHVAPVCTPTRGQLLTGLDALNNKASMVLNGRHLMRRDVVTMPEIFRKNGYKTGIFGKWHLGDTYPDRPMDRGFEKCIWHQGWGLASAIEFDNDYYNTRYLDSLDAHISNMYCTDLWFKEAMKWMDEMNAAKQPFFTYLATNTPHGPLYAPNKDSAFYGGKVNGQEAMFFGMIKNIDDNVASLEKWLTEKKLKKNTILIFMTDNGGTAGVNIYNAGMKGKKASNYEGGHRAACFVRWPKGNFGNPRTIDYPAQIQDILPTLLELIGVNAKRRVSFDGESLKPLLQQENIELGERMFVVQYGGRRHPQKYSSCVVFDSWRLIGKDELYNLQTDPGQKKNIATEQPEVLRKMRAFYENWWNTVEPGLDEIIPIIVGDKNSNEVLLTSESWVGADADNQRAVALAIGPPRGGVFHIDVKTTGKYRLELSRWPFHLNRDMTIPGPDTTIAGNLISRREELSLRLDPSGKSINGIPIPEGRALPISSGCVSLNGNEPKIKTRKPDATAIAIELKLPAGRNTLQAWFKDEKGQELCGAYYVKIKK